MLRRSPLASASIALAVIAAAITFSPRAHADANICSTGPYVEGVDIYAGDGAIDWKMASGAGIRFAYIKATQGDYYKDGEFKTNWANTKSANVLRGAYHFFDPNVNGVTQANYFLAMMGASMSGDLPPMLDLECPDGDPKCLGGSSGAASAATISKALHDWLTTVEAATGRKPVIYTFNAFFSSNNVPTTGLDSLPLYIAYPTTSNCFNVPTPWTAAAFWQWSWTGKVAGIASDVDRDRFMGTLSDLQSFARGGGQSTLSQTNGNDALSIVSFPDGHVGVFASKAGGAPMFIGSKGTDDTWAAPRAIASSGTCGLAGTVVPHVLDGVGQTAMSVDAEGAPIALRFSGASRRWVGEHAGTGTGFSHLSTLTFSDGHVEAFALGKDGAIWVNAHDENGFGEWKSLGGKVATGVAPIVWGDGHAEIFATDAQGVAWHNWQDTSAMPTWQGWKSIGGPALASRPIPARWSDGHVELFARGKDGLLYASDYSSANGGAWPDFAALNAPQQIEGEPSLVVYPATGPEIFARDPQGALLHMWNDGTGKWSAWANDFKQTLASDPLAWMRPDGKAEVFGVASNGDLVKSLHDGMNWTPFAAIGSGLDPCIDGVAMPGMPQPSDDAGAPMDMPPTDAPPMGDAAPTSSSGGCAVSATGTDRAPTGSLFAIAATALVVLRRRRSRR